MGVILPPSRWGSDGVELVLGVHVHAVAEHIPGFHGVGPRRTGIEEVLQLAFPPGPEGVRRQAGVYGQPDTDGGGTLGAVFQLTVLAGVWMVPRQVLEYCILRVS